MRGGRHRWQLALFLAAVFVPCAVLIALGARVVRDDEASRGMRRAAARRQAAVDARRTLSAALGKILADERRNELAPGEGYVHPETIFVGWAEGDALALPWDPERDIAARRCRGLFAQTSFAAAVHACDQMKSRKGPIPALETCFTNAIAQATDPAQAAYARMLWARELDDAGLSRQAKDAYRSLLREPPGITDENGLPLALLAASSLVQQSSDRSGVLRSLEEIIDSRPWLLPMSSLLADDVGKGLAPERQSAEDAGRVEKLRKKLATRSRTLEQAESLQKGFVSIRALLKGRPLNSWVAYGDDPWLLALASPAANATPVFALRGQDILRRLAIPGAVRFSGAGDPEGEALGDSFPRLRLVVSDSLDATGGLERSVLLWALAFAVVATIFAAYLLWRDLKREVRLSELRAQFVSSVSHELKTPLTAIRMFAETLQMGRCAGRETQAEYLGTIVNECERLSRLVDDVLLFSKTEQGKRTYRFRPIQPADAVRAAARALEYPLSQHGFRLHMSLQDDTPAISADRDAVEQAVLNLLSNAMKYSGDSRDIELRLYMEEGEAVISVADYGVGIAAEEHSRIFDKFYRAGTKENQLIPGAGLGLALVAQIMKAHGGRVELESAPGNGSVFRLRFPARADTAVESSE